MTTKHAISTSSGSISRPNPGLGYDMSVAERIWNSKTIKHVENPYKPEWKIVTLTFLLVMIGMFFLWKDSEPDTSRLLHAHEQNFIDIEPVQQQFSQRKWFLQGNLEEVACAPTNQQLVELQKKGPVCWFRTRNNGFIPSEMQLVNLPRALQQDIQDGFMIHVNPDNKTYTVLVWPINTKKSDESEELVDYIERAATYIQSQYKTPSTRLINSAHGNNKDLPSNVVSPSEMELHLFYHLKP